MFELFVGLGLAVVSILGIAYMIIRQDRYCEKFRYDDDDGSLRV